MRRLALHLEALYQVYPCRERVKLSDDEKNSKFKYFDTQISKFKLSLDKLKLLIVTSNFPFWSQKVPT